MPTAKRASDSTLAARELGFLVRLAQAAASTQKPDELLALIIRETTTAMGTDVCSLYLLMPSGRELLLTATNGLNENMVGKVKMKVGEGITGFVAETRSPAVVADVSRDPHWKWVPGLDEDRFHSMLSVPIESGPRLVGVLNAQAAELREFNAGDIDFLRAIAGPDVLGLLAVGIADQAADSEGRVRALEHGSTVLALELSKERAAAEVERRLRGDLVEEMLAGGLEGDEAERIARQAERLGHRLPHRAWVVVLEPDDDETEAAVATRGDRLDAALSGLIRSRMPDALALVRTASAVFLVPDEVAPDLAACEKLAGQILAAATPVMKPGTASVGIGNVANSVAELARSHVEARQALRLTRRAGGRGRVASYRSLGAFRLLLEVQSPEALRRFVEELLGPLLRYAQSRDTPLLETLEALSAARWVRRAAARQLGIHINSMSYRVERIEGLTGLQLDDPETRVAISIALRARAMLGM